MLKIRTMPKQTLAELLLYLAENARFSSIEKIGEGLTVADVRAALKELSSELKKEAQAESNVDLDALKKQVGLSRKAKEIISYLSPLEEKSLYTAFGLIEK